MNKLADLWEIKDKTMEVLGSGCQEHIEDTMTELIKEFSSVASDEISSQQAEACLYDYDYFLRLLDLAIAYYEPQKIVHN